DPPPSGYVDVMANLTGQYLGPGSQTVTAFSILYGVVGSDGVVRTSFSGPTCGVLPSPRDIDYTSFLSGATFEMNDCWVVPMSQVPSLELLAGDPGGTNWLALR
ncbi:MAG: hypothetical protein V7645_2108, partial [Actinomycetota bacterium]